MLVLLTSLFNLTGVAVKMNNADIGKHAKQCLFIADLHLDPERSGSYELALRFLDQASNAQSLFILGDLFEYWIGDDAGLTLYEPVIRALENLSRTGCSLTVLLGNRDFLLGRAFADATGARLVSADEQLITLDTAPILLMHGDTLCTDDTDYQAFRKLVRDPLWQQSFLSLSVEQRQCKALELRNKSKMAGTTKSAEIMDVNEAEVQARLTANACATIIHGHTHRPYLHSSASSRRFVVGDWHSDHAQYVLFDGKQLTLETFRS